MTFDLSLILTIGILSIHFSFYVIAKSYLCTKCGASNTSSEPNFLASFPIEVSTYFPVHLSKRGALSKLVIDLMLSLDENGLGPSAFRRTILELHAKRFDELRVQYYGAALSRKEYHEKNPSLLKTDVPIAPEFKDIYSIPCSNYFRDRFVQVCSSMRDF